MTAAIQRVRIRVEGVVQGVGFRPYVHRLATELGLDGFVRNDERGVVIEVEGDGAAVAALLARLPAEAPPLASVERVVTEAVPAGGARGFVIAASSAGAPDALVSPDVAVCADCLRELFDPADRRYRYPFINCTNCGPRFTIVRGVPYDRPNTTMAGFTMCAACEAEYHDPTDRRFHAQPNACPACGPNLNATSTGSDPARGQTPLCRDRCGLPRKRCETARSSPSRGSVGSISRVWRRTRRRSRGCGRASTVRRSRSR